MALCDYFTNLKPSYQKSNSGRFWTETMQLSASRTQITYMCHYVVKNMRQLLTSQPWWPLTSLALISRYFNQPGVTDNFMVILFLVCCCFSRQKHTLLVLIWIASTTQFGPRQANLVLIAYASSEGSGEPAHPRSLARTFAARSYKQWIKRNLQTESQIPGPSEWLGMRSWNLSWRNARRHKFAWRGSFEWVLKINILWKNIHNFNFCYLYNVHIVIRSYEIVPNLGNELQHDKTNKRLVPTAKTQIILGIHPVWSVFAWDVHFMGTELRT